MWKLGHAFGLLLLAAAYRSYRSRFASLPLHMDTAFYVTNAAIAAKRYRPFRSWNAVFSAGSRILPEMVHSLLFLRLGGVRYAGGFRALYTWLALLAALATGSVAARVVPSPWAFWVATLACAALLAEAQYGAYFESAEAFQTAAQACGMALVVAGLGAHDTLWVDAGLVLLWADFAFVKVTGALPALLVSLALLWIGASQLPVVLAISGMSVLVYLGLARAAGRPLRELLHYLQRHEAYVRRNYGNAWKLLAVKVGFAGILLARNPALPLLALLGLWRVSALGRAPECIVCAAYLLGAILALLRQGNRVWYYMLPLMPALALLASLAFAWLTQELGTTLGAALFGAALASSVLRNLWLVRGPNALDRARRVFSVYNRAGGAFGDAFAVGNSAVEQACDQMRERVRGSTLLVVGRYNQASVLLEAGYDTPIASVCELSEAVAGDLHTWLPTRLGGELPAFLIDTNHELPARVAQLPWMVDYELAQEVGQVRLFARRSANSRAC
jgi:hypothetical protein